MFTAALPAAICAGVTEAFRVMEQEPEHRENLWRNVHTLSNGLGQVGFEVPVPESPIIPVFIGSETLLWLISRDLFRTGVKAGCVAYPAVPRNEAIVRLAVNARHTTEDLERTVAIFERLGKTYGILGRTHDEIREVGRCLSLSRKAAA